MEIEQLGNMYDASSLLIEGGSNSTWFKVVHASDQIVPFQDYPSIKDGKLLSWIDKDFWKYKVTRTRQSVKLTVAGNAVCAEGALKELGYDAHAVQSDTVYVILPDSETATEIN